MIYVKLLITYGRMHSRSVVSDSVTPRTVAHQAPLSMEFSRQECWSGLLFPTPNLGVMNFKSYPVTLWAPVSLWSSGAVVRTNTSKTQSTWYQVISK